MFLKNIICTPILTQTHMWAAFEQEMATRSSVERNVNSLNFIYMYV